MMSAQARPGELTNNLYCGQCVPSPWQPPAKRTLTRNSVDAAEALIALKRREEDGYLYSQYARDFVNFRNSSAAFVGQQNPLNVAQLNNEWRRKMSSWIYTVVEYFPILPDEVAVSAMSYFDRYLAKRCGNNASEQMVLLCALGSLRLATKLYCQDKVSMYSFILLGRGQFTEEDIELMEFDILAQLMWKVHPPSPIEFVIALIQLLPPLSASSSSSTSSSREIRHQLQLLSTEVLRKKATCDSFFVWIPSSTVAFASVLNAIEDLGLVSALGTGSLFIPMVASISSLHPNDCQVQAARLRLRELSAQNPQDVPF